MAWVVGSEKKSTLIYHEYHNNFRSAAIERNVLSPHESALS